MAPMQEDGPRPIFPEPDFKSFGSEDQAPETFFFQATTKPVEEEQLPSFEDSKDSFNLGGWEGGKNAEAPVESDIQKMVISVNQPPNDLNISHASDDTIAVRPMDSMNETASEPDTLNIPHDEEKEGGIDEAQTTTTDTPTEGPTDPTEAPIDPTEALTDATEGPTDATEGPTDPTEAPTDATEGPTDAPTDSPTDAPTDTSTTDSSTDVPTDAPTGGPKDSTNDALTESMTRELPPIYRQVLMKEAYREMFAKLMEARINVMMEAERNRSMMANRPYNPMMNPGDYRQLRIAQQLAMQQAIRSMQHGRQGYGTEGSSRQMSYQQPYEMASGAYNGQNRMSGNQIAMNQYQNQQRIQQMMLSQQQANSMYGQGGNSAQVGPSFQEPVKKGQSEEEEMPTTIVRITPTEEEPAETTKEATGRPEEEEREVSNEGEEGNEDGREESDEAATEEERKEAFREESNNPLMVGHENAHIEPPSEEPPEESEQPEEPAKPGEPPEDGSGLPRFPARSTGDNKGTVLGLDERINLTEEGEPKEEEEDEATAFENQAYADKLREVSEPADDEGAPPSLEDSGFLDQRIAGSNTPQVRRRPRRLKKPRFLVKANIRRLSQERLRKAKWLGEPPPEYCLNRLLITDECPPNSAERRWSYNFDDGKCYLYEDPCPEGKQNSFTSLSQCVANCWRQFSDDYF